jgi:hypothetical protein
MDAGVQLQKQRTEIEDKPAFDKGLLYTMYCDVASRIQNILINKYITLTSIIT